MNIVDYALLALLLAMVIVGSKKGLIRELAAFVTLIPAVVVTINLMDTFSVFLYDNVGGNPMVVTFLSFIILLGLVYAAFKLLGMGIAKIIHLKNKGRRDQMGGAFVGFVRGWVVISFIFFLLFLLPMPATFYLKVEQSLFGPTLVKTIPLIYESSSMFHPKSPSFIGKVENTLRLEKSRNRVSTEDQGQVELVLTQMQRFFYSGVR